MYFQGFFLIKRERFLFSPYLQQFLLIAAWKNPQISDLMKKYIFNLNSKDKIIFIHGKWKNILFRIVIVLNFNVCDHKF